jgi:hypothetical protein
MKTEFWICGQWKGDDKPWEFQGVFETEAQAIAACVADNYFIFPATLNKEWPQQTVWSAGGYYPHLETKEQGAERERAYAEERQQS